MVVLPYKDRLLLFSRYLQQLVMESLGKELDRGGRTVRQGLVVYGNKGSTDQHAFIQQLRDGADNFFVTFIEVLRERDGELIEVEPDTTAGDYLGGFLLGTRRALTESGRESITLTVPEIGPRTRSAC
jgi:glucose-6-phosphate isomerase